MQILLSSYSFFTLTQFLSTFSRKKKERKQLAGNDVNAVLAPTVSLEPCEQTTDLQSQHYSKKRRAYWPIALYFL